MDQVPGQPAEELTDFMLAEYELILNFRQNLVAHAESRVNFFMATVSGAVVALGLLNDSSISPEKAYLISGFILVGLFLFGFALYAQLVVRSIGVVQYTRGLNRIRRYFTERHPSSRKYLTLPSTDVKPSFSGIGIGQFLSDFGPLFGLPQLVSIINSFIGGTGLAIWTVQVPIVISGWSVDPAIAGGILVCVLFLFHHAYYYGKVKRANSSFRARFPTRQGSWDGGDF